MDRRGFMIKSLAAAGGAMLSPGLVLGLARTGRASDTIWAHHSVKLTAQAYGSSISVRYSTIPGNNPAANGNTIHVWESAGSIYDTAPLISVPVTGARSAGLQIVDTGVQLTDYWGVAYSTSPQVATACAFYTPGVAVNGVPFQVHILPVWAGGSLTAVRCYTITGNDPQANGNWIGVWQGDSATFDGGGLIKSVPVGYSRADGTVNLGEGITSPPRYTVGYFVGESYSDLVATSTSSG